MESPLQQLLRAVEARCRDGVAQAQSLSPEPAAIAAAAEAACSAAIDEPLLPDVLSVLLNSSVQGCVADPQHVASAKQRGAAAFARGQHRQAARLFTEALKYCDEGAGGEQGAPLAARLYANRALCLARLQPPALEAALQDARSAVLLDPQYAKAWYRRACILRDLARGGGTAALADARRALELLQEQGAGGGDVAEAAALVSELEEAAAAAAAAAEPGSSGGAGEPAPEAANGVHPAAPGAAAAEAAAEAAAAAAAADLAELVRLAAPQLAVEETAAEGRRLAAAAPLAPGCDVLQERPLGLALTKPGRRSVCATCMAPLASSPAPYHCRRCPLPAYCSAACRDADPCHSPGGPECGLPWSVLLPTEAVAALRLARQLSQQDGSGSGGAGVGAAAACQVAALGTHWSELHACEAAQLAALAAVAHAAWTQAVAEGAAAGTSQSSGGGAGSGSITAAAVLAALCRLQVNGLAVVPAERRGAEDRLGLALYPVGALMNHSCRPNVAVRFEGCRLVVRALEPLEPGQPVLHCYGPQAGEMTGAQRRLMLQQHYHFLCRCRACAAAEADRLADTAPAGLRCPAAGSAAAQAGAGTARCSGAVLPACAVPEGLLHRYPLPAGGGACCSCGAALSPRQWEEAVLPDVRAAAEAHAAAAALLEQQECGQQGQQAQQQARTPPPAMQAVLALRQCLRLRQQHLHPHSLLLGSTHDALAHAWHLAGNHEAAADALRHSLAVLRHAYPAGSTAIAFQQRQLAQALRLAAAAAAAGSSGGAAAAERLLAEARQAEEEADAALQLHFGPLLA